MQWDILILLRPKGEASGRHILAQSKENFVTIWSHLTNGGVGTVPALSKQTFVR